VHGGLLFKFASNDQNSKRRTITVPHQTVGTGIANRVHQFNWRISMIRKTTLSLLLFLAITAGCATNRTAATDRQIENDVRTQISSVMTGHMYTADIAVNNGAVTLTGNARTEEERRAIAEAANKVKNVKSVINNIVVTQ
jgi:hypothetical protein